MKNAILVLFLILFLSSCKINQTINNLREGKWVETTTLDSIDSKNIVLKSVGYYKKGEPVKKWKYYRDGKIEKKEVYKKDITFLTFYHNNGKVSSQGKTKFIKTNKETHWFYFDKWKFYSELGKLIEIKTYDSGKLISTDTIHLE